MTGVFKCSSLYGAFVATGHMPIFGKLTCLNSTSKLPSLRYMLATYNLGTHTCIYTWLGVFVPPWTCSGTYHLHSMCILLATCTSSTLGIPIFNVFFFLSFFPNFIWRASLTSEAMTTTLTTSIGSERQRQEQQYGQQQPQRFQ